MTKPLDKVAQPLVYVDVVGWCISTLDHKCGRSPPSVTYNSKKPSLCKALLSLFSLVIWFSLRTSLLEGRGEEFKAQEEHFLVLTLFMEKESRKDRDWSKLSIARPRTSITIGLWDDPN